MLCTIQLGFHFYHYFPAIIGILTIQEAQKGRPIIPIDSLLPTVQKAVSGKPSETRWERYTVGDFERRVHRFSGFWMTEDKNRS